MPTKLPASLAVSPRPDDPKRPCMVYWQGMNIPTAYADADTVAIICGIPEAMGPLADLARQLDGVTVVKPGPTGINMLEALIPVDGLLRLATPAEVKKPTLRIVRPMFDDMPSVTLLERASDDCRDDNRVRKEKYQNRFARATRWPDGTPEHVLASLATPDDKDPDLVL